MGDTEMDDMVRTLAREAVTLIEQRAIVPLSATPSHLGARDALVHLASVLHTELTMSVDDDTQLRLCGRDAMETWLIGHASLVLGETSEQLRDGRRSHEDIARLLDDAIYGQSERPKAFRRHLRSFYDEIDIEESVEGARFVEHANNGKRIVPTFDIGGSVFSLKPFNWKKLQAELERLGVEED